MAVARIRRLESVLNNARAANMAAESFAELGGDIVALISGIGEDKMTHVAKMQEQIVAQKMGLGDPVLEKDLARHGFMKQE